ncbi:MAG: hypothetical protein HY725_16595 [Candidatus Rokubacteria bacterium]|nr:hypothetical protein [Candidatus Rokubacteria bacterium]
MTQRFTHSKIPLKPVSTPEDVAGLPYGETLNDPGAYPYTRGRRADHHESWSWIQRELSGEDDPSRSNAQFKALLGMGATGLDVIGDTPTMAPSGCRSFSVEIVTPRFWR